MARIGREQGFNDDLLTGLVDFGDVVVDLLLRDANGLDVECGAVDDGAGGASGLDGHVEHGMQVGSGHGLCGLAGCLQRAAGILMGLEERGAGVRSRQPYGDFPTNVKTRQSRPPAG